ALFRWHLAIDFTSLPRPLATAFAHFRRFEASVATMFTVPASSPSASMLIPGSHQMSPACWSADPAVFLSANSVVASMLTLPVIVALVQVAASFAWPAWNFSWADLPVPPLPAAVSHASSPEAGACALKAAEASLLWHLITPLHAFA